MGQADIAQRNAGTPIRHILIDSRQTVVRGTPHRRSGSSGSRATRLPSPGRMWETHSVARWDLQMPLPALGASMRAAGPHGRRETASVTWDRPNERARRCPHRCGFPWRGRATQTRHRSPTCTAPRAPGWRERHPQRIRRGSRAHSSAGSGASRQEPQHDRACTRATNPSAGAWSTTRPARCSSFHPASDERLGIRGRPTPWTASRSVKTRNS